MWNLAAAVCRFSGFSFSSACRSSISSNSIRLSCKRPAPKRCEPIQQEIPAGEWRLAIAQLHNPKNAKIGILARVSSLHNRRRRSSTRAGLNSCQLHFRLSKFDGVQAASSLVFPVLLVLSHLFFADLRLFLLLLGIGVVFLFEAQPALNWEIGHCRTWKAAGRGHLKPCRLPAALY